MLTFTAPNYTNNNQGAYPKTQPADQGKSPTDSPFASCPALELWECEHNILAAGESRMFRVRFTKGRPVRLRAWAKANLGISIQDAIGCTVARENRTDGRPNYRIQPPRSGEYLLELVNPTDQEAHYVLYIAEEPLKVT